ncbi:MAG: hypothetical protein U0271_44835 [Polyangiaceae bacterium]
MGGTQNTYLLVPPAGPPRHSNSRPLSPDDRLLVLVILAAAFVFLVGVFVTAMVVTWRRERRAEAMARQASAAYGHNLAVVFAPSAGRRRLRALAVLLFALTLPLLGLFVYFAATS